MVAQLERDDMLFFSLHVAGAGRLQQQGQVATLGPGSGALYESRTAWEMDVATPVHCLFLQFPRSAQKLRSVEIKSALARGMNFSTPAMQLFSEYVGQLGRLADDLSAAQRQHAGLVAIDMLAMALRDSPAAIPQGESGDPVHLELIRRHVRERLRDPELTVTSLAQQHHISVRHTHVLFSQIGMTPGAYIRRQRLLAARAMLSNPRLARHTIAQIAAAVGMLELRTFERAFVREYGVTPAQWRRGGSPESKLYSE
jgi:AraC-like DNA-binding protein